MIFQFIRDSEKRVTISLVLGIANLIIQLIWWIWLIESYQFLRDLFQDLLFNLIYFSSFFLLPPIGLIFGLTGLKSLSRRRAIKGIILNTISLLSLIFGLMYAIYLSLSNWAA